MVLLKRHFIDKEEISKICQEEGLQPSQFYRWQAMLFSEGAAVFQRKNGLSERKERIAALEKMAALE